MVEKLDFVSGRELHATRFHSCLRRAHDQRVAKIDLRLLNWTDPAGLVGLASLIEAQSRLGRDVVLRGPTAQRRSQFLHRMGLGDLVRSFGGEHDLHPSTVWDQRGYLLELQRFDGRDTGGLALVVREQLPDGPVAMAVHKGISEIGTNALDHSSSGHGYIAVVTVPESREVRFAVSDAGVGMVEPLRSRGFSSDEEVLDQVLSGGLSRLNQAGRGRGVKRTREVVTSAGGEIYIASGQVGVKAWFNGTRDLRQTQRHPLGIEGTLFQAALQTAT
jgi:hypothetical protein